MNRIKIFYLVLLSSLGYGQNLTVNYKTVILDPESTFVELSENELVINPGSSMYFSTRLDTIFVTDIGDLASNALGKRALYQFKDFKKKQVYSSLQFSGGIVIDSSYSIKWKIVNDKKSILGYSCQGATAHFRGRDYKAYFTSEIPIKEGPFKFDGLPGLIMQVLSDDGAVKITATGIKKTEEVVVNPFSSKKDRKTMNWEEYVKIYENQFKKFEAMPITVDEKNGISMSSKTSIPKRFIEVMVQ